MVNNLIDSDIMSVLKTLDRPIAFQRHFVSLTGSITGALFLSQSVYWHNRNKSEDGWWWKTQKEWEEETGMTRRELETARAACARFIKFERRGVPATSFYKIDEESLASSLAEYANLDCPKPPIQNGGNGRTGMAEPAKQHIRETTSETTPHKLAGASGRVPTEKQKEAWRLKQISDRVKELWLAAYATTFPNQPYQITGADLGQLRLFVRETKLTAEEIIKLATDAWAFKSKERFSHARNLRSLCYLCSKFNEIKSEINENGKNSGSNGNGKTLNQGANGSSQYRGVGKLV